MRFWILAVFFLSFQCLSAPINRCKSSSGTTIFTDRPCSDLGAASVGSRDYDNAGSRADGLTADQRQRVDRLDKRLGVQLVTPAVHSESVPAKPVLQFRCQSIEQNIKSLDAAARLGYLGDGVRDKRRKLRDQWFDLGCSRL